MSAQTPADPRSMTSPAGVAPRPRRAPFLLLLLAVLGAGLCTLLVLNTATAASEVQERRLDASNRSLTDSAQQLSRDIAAAQAPASLARMAAALGLVPADSPAFLRLNADGSATMLGKPARVRAPITAAELAAAREAAVLQRKADALRAAAKRKNDAARALATKKSEKSKATAKAAAKSAAAKSAAKPQSKPTATPSSTSGAAPAKTSSPRSSPTASPTSSPTASPTSSPSATASATRSSPAHRTTGAARPTRTQPTRTQTPTSKTPTTKTPTSKTPIAKTPTGGPTTALLPGGQR